MAIPMYGNPSFDLPRIVAAAVRKATDDQARSYLVAPAEEYVSPPEDSPAVRVRLRGPIGFDTLRGLAHGTVQVLLYETEDDSLVFDKASLSNPSNGTVRSWLRRFRTGDLRRALPSGPQSITDLGDGKRVRVLTFDVATALPVPVIEGDKAADHVVSAFDQCVASAISTPPATAPAQGVRFGSGDSTAPRRLIVVKMHDCSVSDPEEFLPGRHQRRAWLTVEIRPQVGVSRAWAVAHAKRTIENQQGRHFDRLGRVARAHVAQVLTEGGRATLFAELVVVSRTEADTRAAEAVAA